MTTTDSGAGSKEYQERIRKMREQQRRTEAERKQLAEQV